MLEGRYYFPRSARSTPARAQLAGASLNIADESGAQLAEVLFKQVRVSGRLARIARRFELSGGACFETADNDGADDLMRAGGRRPGHGIDRLERSFVIVAASVAVAAFAIYALVRLGIPSLAEVLAHATPKVVAEMASDQTVNVFDAVYLKPTALDAKTQKKALALFRKVARAAPRGENGYQLLLRGGGTIGPNAFALPDGRIVLTDELWKLAADDEEIEGVFAHEMSHVDHAHSLQRVYEASLLPAALAIFTGDVSQVTQITMTMPAMLVQSAYSRAAETQADDDAGRLLLRIGGHPAKMAALLARLEKRTCGKQKCAPGWLGDHPETQARVEHLQSFKARAKK